VWGRGCGEFAVKRIGLFVAATILAAFAATLFMLPGQGPKGAEAAVPAGSTVPYQGGAWNLHGANMAWYNWACDFGCGPNGGVSSTGGAMGQRLAQAQQAGLRNVRWWMFEGNAWQVTRDASGMPTGINPAVYTDLDAALALARQYDLYYTLVLFNFPGDIPQSWVNDPVQRQKLAEVLAPLFARYANEPRIFSWEVFNEPEWDMWNGKVNSANTQATVRGIVNAVHANSSKYVTVGSAMLDGLTFWTGMGLDYYQAHWYDYMQPGDWNMPARDYSSVKAQYGIDGPLVVGEFFSGTGQAAVDRWETFYTRGYAGSWAWSLFPEKTADKMAIDFAAASTFTQRHASVVGPRNGGGGSLPQLPPTATPTETLPTRAPTLPPAVNTPAAQPTNPPAQPTNPPAQPPASTTNWVTVASASPSALATRQQVTANVSVTAPKAGNYLIDVEFYNPAGEKVYQKWYDSQAFTAGQARTYAVNWTPPANAAKGDWVVKIGVFTPGWSQLVAWDNETGGAFTLR